MTVKKLIKRSMRVAGILAAGETPTADEINDALDTLNDILTDWNSKGMGLVTQPEISIPVVSGEHEYHIGLSDPGGVQFISAERPEVIKSAYWRDGSLDTDIDQYSSDRYDAIPDKSQPGTPSVFTYDATAPCGIVKLWPVPNITGTVIVRVSATPLTKITNVNLSVDSLMPKSYSSALKWVLASELCPEYGRQVPSLVFSLARSSIRNIEGTILARSMTTNMVSNPSKVNIFNI